MTSKTDHKHKFKIQNVRKRRKPLRTRARRELFNLIKGKKINLDSI